MPFPLSTLCLLAFAIVGNASANILIKAGSLRLGETKSLADFALKAATSPHIVGGAALFVIVLAAYSAVLTKIPLSIGYPLMTSLGFVIVTLASAFFFKESIHPVQIAGIALILVGLWLVTRYFAPR